MRVLLSGVLLAALATPSIAEDVVRLRRGGSLRGEIRSQSEHEVVLILASGEIRIPRSQIARIEAARDPESEGVRLIKRDEWSLLLLEKRVVGWMRVLHWERGDLIHLEEHRVLFRNDEEPRRERRRVEIVDRKGVAREYLWMESRVGRMEVWSGQIQNGRHVRQHRHEGRVQTVANPWPEGASLPLPMWAHTLDNLGASTRTVLDPRSGEFEERRFERSAGRYFGAVWEGTIVATTPERVAFARRVHARADPVKVAAAAKLHPLTPREPDRLVHHVAAGVSLRAPDKIWVETIEGIERGRLMVLENRSSFARVELYTGPAVVAADGWRGLREQLNAMHDYVARVGEPADGLQRVEVRQGKERMLGLVRIVPRKGEYVALVALVPLRRWGTEREAVAGILRSASVVE